MTGTAYQSLGRRLRLGVIGGGPASFIGAMHRAAAQLDGRFVIEAGVLSSDPARAREAGAALGLPRSYGSAAEMFAAEAARPDGIDAVAVMTPNDRHHAECSAAFAAGLDVICDKPITNTLDDAADLARIARAGGHVFCLTHAYSAYPMIRQARAMVAAGAIGAVRAVQVEYLQAGMSAAVETLPLTPKLAWKLDTARSGPSLVLGDIGTHAHHLACYVTGLSVERLAADLGALVPNRRVDDYGAFLLRMTGGVRGTLLASQALAGTENDLNLRVFGETGHLEWTHRDHDHLRHAPQGKPVQVLARGDAGLLPAAARLTRMARGHPEGLLEAFANLYRDAAEAIAARLTGAAPDPLAEFPDAGDGAAGIAFVAAAVASAGRDGAWVDVPSAN
jgi:predicted dehydrogenase